MLTRLLDLAGIEGCQASIFRPDNGTRVFFSNPHNALSRVDMTVQAEQDRGRRGPTVERAGAGAVWRGSLFLPSWSAKQLRRRNWAALRGCKARLWWARVPDSLSAHSNSTKLNMTTRRLAGGPLFEETLLIQNCCNFCSFVSCHLPDHSQPAPI